MVSPANPTHFWMEAPERCSTTTQAWWAAAALTQVLAGLADDVGDEVPQAAVTRASVALAHMRRLRTSIPPGGQPSRTRRRKPTARKLPYRCARTGRRCGRSGLLACGSPPQPAFPRPLASVVFDGQGLPAHSCATAPVSHRIPLVPIEILARAGGSRCRRVALTLAPCFRLRDTSRIPLTGGSVATRIEAVTLGDAWMRIASAILSGG